MGYKPQGQGTVLWGQKTLQDKASSFDRINVRALFNTIERALKKIERSALKVMAYEEEMRALTDEELQAKTPYFKELLANGKDLDDILKWAE